MSDIPVYTPTSAINVTPKFQHRYYAFPVGVENAQIIGRYLDLDVSIDAEYFADLSKSPSVLITFTDGHLSEGSRRIACEPGDYIVVLQIGNAINSDRTSFIYYRLSNSEFQNQYKIVVE